MDRCRKPKTTGSHCVTLLSQSQVRAQEYHKWSLLKIKEILRYQRTAGAQVKDRLSNMVIE